jgi:DNA-binding response OmpR family regulator
LVSKIKQADPDIGILIVADEECDRSRLLRRGCEDFAKTPVSAQTIINKVLMLIAKRRLAEDGQN